MARDAGNVTGKLRRYAARRSIVDCSSLNNTIATQCSQSSVADVALPQGQCSISSQIVIPNGCVVNVSGTDGTIISGSSLTRHFYVPSTSSLNLQLLKLVDGYAAGNGVNCDGVTCNGVRKHPSLALALNSQHISHFNLNLNLKGSIYVEGALTMTNCTVSPTCLAVCVR